MNLFVTQLQESFSLFKAGKFEECLKKLADAKAAYTGNQDNKNVTLEDLLQFEGGVYYHLEKYTEALQSFEAALQENPKSSFTCLHLGKTLIQLGQQENARLMLEYALHYDENNTEAATILKEFPAEVVQPETAETPKADVNEAMHLFEQKQYAESLKVLTAVEIDYKEQLAGVFNFKGFNLLALRETGKAKDAFEEARKINPSSSQAYAGLGEVLYLQNKDAEAAEMYEKALSLNPDNHFAKSGLEKSRKTEVKIETPVLDMKAIENGIEKAFASFSAKQYDEALVTLAQPEAQLRKIKNVDVQLMSRLLNFKGFVYLGKQDKENARIAFEEALKVNPTSSQSATGLGEVFFLDNNLHAAKEMYEWGLKLNVDNKFAASCLEKVNKILAQ